MVVAAAWILFALGVAHIALGLVWFRQPVVDAIGEGFVGKFKKIDSRRLAFWFIIFGPLLMMGGHVAVHAAASSNFDLLKILGFYIFAISLIGVLALPKSPFWAALLLSPIFIAGGYGWLL